MYVHAHKCVRTYKFTPIKYSHRRSGTGCRGNGLARYKVPCTFLCRRSSSLGDFFITNRRVSFVWESCYGINLMRIHIFLFLSLWKCIMVQTRLQFSAERHLRARTRANLSTISSLCLRKQRLSWKMNFQLDIGL